MFRSLFGTDWRKSPAHLLLLSKFLDPRTAEDFTKSDNWKEVLKESPQQTIKRFIDGGMLTQADLSGHLAYKFKVTELKNMLKQRGLPVSGRKEDLIARLVQADADGMKKAIAGLIVIHCTEQGRVVAEQYLNSEKEKRARVEQQIMEAIQKRKFKEATQSVAAFEAEQVFQRGIGIDWKNYNPSRDVAILSKRVFGNCFGPYSGSHAWFAWQHSGPASCRRSSETRFAPPQTRNKFRYSGVTPILAALETAIR